MVIKQEVFVLSSATQVGFAHGCSSARMSDSVALALMVRGGQHSSVALEGAGEESRILPSFTGVTGVTAESWASAHCTPPQTTQIQRELFKILDIPFLSVLQSVGLYLCVF